MKRIFSHFSVFVLFLAASVLVLAQSDPRVGTWKLSLAKSKYDPGPPPKSEMRTVLPVGDGIKVSIKTVNASGKVVSQGFTANYDGKDYPYTGSSDFDSIAMKRTDPYINNTVLKKNGKEVATTRSVVSRDGKVFSITLKGTNASGQPVNNVQVYDKQ